MLPNSVTKLLTSPAAECDPMYTLPFRMMPPPMPVPNTRTRPLSTPARDPVHASAAAAHFPSLAMTTGTPRLCSSKEAKGCSHMNPLSIPPVWAMPRLVSMRARHGNGTALKLAFPWAAKPSMVASRSSMPVKGVGTLPPETFCAWASVRLYLINVPPMSIKRYCFIFTSPDHPDTRSASCCSGPDGIRRRKDSPLFRLR